MGKSSGPTHSTVTQTGEIDHEYNRRMAAIAEAQQEMAEEMMGYYREFGVPYESAQMQALARMLPYQERYETDAVQMQTGLLPLEERAQRDAYGLQSQQAGLTGDYYTAMGQAGMPQQIVDTRSQFLQEAREGINVGERMGMAQSDVLSGFQGALSQQRLADSRMGLRPESGAAMARSQDLAIGQAGAITGARTQARVGAEDEQYRRLQQAATTGLTV